jgi:acetyl-CoA carboxylase carboxyl transferase subunit alpha
MSEAIARNLFEMVQLQVPIVSVVIGEGGSGGALAIGVCDRLLMLQYSIYAVASPEASATILWRSADKKDLVVDAMGVGAERLAKLGLVDEIIKEPLGGAHRDTDTAINSAKAAILRHLRELQLQSPEQVIATRAKRYREVGVFTESGMKTEATAISTSPQPSDIISTT